MNTNETINACGCAGEKKRCAPVVNQFFCNCCENDYDGGNGHNPYIIGENGNWFQWSVDQNYVDTGVSASGKDGKNGQDGKNAMIKIEYASNNSTTGMDDLTDVYCTNEPEGSRGLKLNLANLVNKKIKFPTPYNPDTDFLMIELRDNLSTWRPLLAGWTGFGGTAVAPYTVFTNSSGSFLSGGLGIAFYETNEIALVYGRYRVIDLRSSPTDNWSTITQDWYWRVKKLTIA